MTDIEKKAQDMTRREMLEFLSNGIRVAKGVLDETMGLIQTLEKSRMMVVELSDLEWDKLREEEKSNIIQLFRG